MDALAPGRGLTAITFGWRQKRRWQHRLFSLPGTSLAWFVVVDDAPFHAAGDGDELAADVAGEDVRGENDDLRSHVLGLADLAQGHRPRDAADRFGVDEA